MNDKKIWWIVPEKLMIIILFVYVAMGIGLGRGYTCSFWEGGVLILSCLLGIILASKIKILPPKLNLVPAKERGNSVLLLLFVFSVFGYFVWFAIPFLFDYEEIFKFISSGEEMFNIRALIKTRPGITTMTQFAVAYSAVYSFFKYSIKIKMKVAFDYGFLLLGALTAIRAWLWGERLALIEYILPFAVTYVMHAETKTSTRKILAYFPVAGVLGVYFFFVFSEYFRSWRTYSGENGSILYFSFDRLFKYYSLSIDNGIGFNDWLQSPNFNGYFTLNFLYNLPVAKSYMAEFVNNSTSFYTYLIKCANPEFNTMSWPLAILSDLGFLSSALLFLFFGFFYGIAFKFFLMKNKWGVIYPILYVSLLEMLREPYIHGPRVVYIFAGVLVFWVLFKEKQDEGEI